MSSSSDTTRRVSNWEASEDEDDGKEAIAFAFAFAFDFGQSFDFFFAFRGGVPDRPSAVAAAAAAAAAVVTAPQECLNEWATSAGWTACDHVHEVDVKRESTNKAHEDGELQRYEAVDSELQYVRAHTF